MKFARIEGGVVREVIDAGDNDIEKMFTPQIVATLIACDDTVSPGQLWDGQDFQPPPPAPAEPKPELTVGELYLALKGKGVVVDGDLPAGVEVPK